VSQVPTVSGTFLTAAGRVPVGGRPCSVPRGRGAAAMQGAAVQDARRVLAPRPAGSVPSRTRLKVVPPAADRRRGAQSSALQRTARSTRSPRRCPGGRCGIAIADLVGTHAGPRVRRVRPRGRDSGRGHEVRTSNERGFTLIELAIILVVMGIVAIFAVPSVGLLSQSHQLKAATENVAAQIRVAREKAIATSPPNGIMFHVNTSYLGTDYHMHNNGVIDITFKLPKGISFDPVSNGASTTMMKDGTASNSMTLVLQDRRGNRDTVSVLMSGLVLTK
jgi:type II secretory pathway pseudopilin PulG